MLKNLLNIALQAALVFIMIYGLIFHQMVIYGIQQGNGQMRIIVNAKPIEDVLKGETYPDSLKHKLLLIQKVKQFTIDSIGMLPSKNYTTVYNQFKQPILYAITACKPYTFKAKEWDFPFLGTVSYKGFFDKKKADKEVYSLKLNSYDVDIYSPSGWSTLGWLQDPVLSNMLYKTEAQLINLIIHELTHGTLFVKNDVTFNENLANFIADKGTAYFLKTKYGIQSKQFEDYKNKKSDQEKYKAYMLKSYNRLDSLYATMKGIHDSVKKEKKHSLITEIVRGVNKLPLYNKRPYFKYTLQAFKSGNAFFMSFNRYDSQYDTFEKEYKEQHNSNLYEYMVFLKEKYPSL